MFCEWQNIYNRKLTFYIHLSTVVGALVIADLLDKRPVHITNPKSKL